MRGVKKGGMGSVGTSEDGEESSSVQDEDEEAILIENFLSNIKAPQVQLHYLLSLLLLVDSNVSCRPMITEYTHGRLQHFGIKTHFIII